jgi:hypothetical protein
MDRLKPNIDKFVSFFNSHGTFAILLSGGEPFQFNGFLELVTKLTEKHSMLIYTSLVEDVVEFTNKVDSSKFLLMRCGLHPIMLSRMDLFFERIKLLKDTGFKPIVCLPVHSKNFALLPKIHDICSKLDVGFEPSIFTDENCQTIYTPEERKELSKWMTTRVCQRQIDWMTNCTRGMNCIAGWRNVIVDWDGKIYRCPMDRADLGNIYENRLNLRTVAYPCPGEYCACRNYHYDEVCQNYNGEAMKEQEKLAKGYIPPLGD